MDEKNTQFQETLQIRVSVLTLFIVILLYVFGKLMYLYSWNKHIYLNGILAKCISCGAYLVSFSVYGFTLVLIEADG